MIGDDIDAALPEMRAHAASLMRDGCRVERLAEGRTFDDATGEYAESWEPVYAGACRVQVAATQPDESDTGGRGWVVTDAVVQLPVSGVDFRDNDRVTITGCLHDPAMVGVVLTVTSREVKTHATMRRLHVSEVRGR